MRDLKDWIKKHECFKAYPFLNSLGMVVIGWGHVLDEKGITVEEATLIFDNDLETCIKDLSQYQWYTYHPSHVQYALVNMCFSLGIGRLLSFKKMIESLKHKDYASASLEVLDSSWAIKVGKRAKDVALMMRQG